MRLGVGIGVRGQLPLTRKSPTAPEPSRVTMSLETERVSSRSIKNAMPSPRFGIGRVRSTRPWASNIVICGRTGVDLSS